MLGNRTRFSMISNQNIRRPLVRASVSIFPDRSFSELMLVIQTIFPDGIFEYSNRFDEVPAYVSIVDRHEIILFGIPEDEVDYQYYEFHISPKRPILEGFIEDITSQVIDLLCAFGLQPIYWERVVGQSKLRASGARDVFYIVQDAAVRNLSNYDSIMAKAINLPGPSIIEGTPYHIAYNVRCQLGGGTLAAELRISYKALRLCGYSEADARQMIVEARENFRKIGHEPTAITRVPRNRRRINSDT